MSAPDDEVPEWAVRAGRGVCVKKQLDGCNFQQAAEIIARAWRESEEAADYREQIRLNGMGAEREARLLARVAELERESASLRAYYGDGEMVLKRVTIEGNRAIITEVWEHVAADELPEL
jgi:hypothetical protein